MTDEKIVASGLLDALEDADIEFRYLMPEIFERVDAIKAAPGWVPTGHQTLRSTRMKVGECAWCGDEFVYVTYPSKPPQRCCSPACNNEYQRWMKRRAKRAAA